MLAVVGRPSLSLSPSFLASLYLSPSLSVCLLSCLLVCGRKRAHPARARLQDQQLCSQGWESNFTTNGPCTRSLRDTSDPRSSGGEIPCA